MPGGLPRGPQLRQGIIEAAPLFNAMAAGYASGRGPYAYMDQGAALIAARMKQQRDEEAQRAASAAFGGIMRPGGMGGGGRPMAPPGPGAQVADDTMRALGRTPMRPYRDAIASIESAGSGDYAAVGPRHPTLGRALGRYQVMEANVGPWTEKHLGRRMTPEEFLADPRAQDAVFDGEFGSYVQKYGPEGAAQAWFAGPGGVGKLDRKDSLGTTVADYTRKFSGALGGGQEAAPAPAVADPMQDPYIQQMLGVLAMPGLTPQQQQVIQMQIESRMRALAPPEARKGVVVGNRIIDPSSGEVIYEPGPGQAPLGEYGLQPIYGRDAQGNMVVMQLGKDGTAVATKLPEGVTPDLAMAAQERARGAEVGKQTGAAQMDLGGAIAKAEAALGLIDQIANDPALPSITGMIQGRLPPLTQAGTDLEVKIQQLQGKVFLEAFESLKGGGQITEVEGQKAEAAMARLRRAQSPEAYKAALNELADVVRIGVGRARTRAGQSGAVAPAGDDDAPPPGIDPQDWQFLTPEERAVFR